MTGKQEELMKAVAGAIDSVDGPSVTDILGVLETLKFLIIHNKLSSSAQ